MMTACMAKACKKSCMVTAYMAKGYTARDWKRWWRALAYKAKACIDPQCTVTVYLIREVEGEQLAVSSTVLLLSPHDVLVLVWFPIWPR